MMMTFLLPLVLLISTLALNRYLKSVREAAVWSIIFLGLVLVMITEVLSISRMLTPLGLIITWSMVAAAWIVIYLRLQVKRHYALHLTLSIDGWLLLAGIISIMGLTLLTALIAPPNTWDSMTYHMPRVFYWQQFRTVEHFPTSVDRMLWNPPFAEFAIAHLQILTGSDRFANVVQWIAMVYSGIVVSLIVREFGINSLTKQLFGVLVLFTLPMGIMQATSTQNDYVAALWTLCVAWFVFRSVNTSHERQIDILGIGISSGLAMLTKGTAYIYILPLLLWFGLDYLLKWRLNIWRPVYTVTIIFVTTMLINGGHYVRNISLFDSPLAPAGRQNTHRNQVANLRGMLSIGTRNLAMHLYIPDEINRKINLRQGVMNYIHGFHDLLDISVNEPGTAYSNQQFALPARWQAFHEDFGTNILHLFFLLVTAPFIVVGRRFSQKAVVYLLVLIVQFSILSLLFKWQPWGIRLQMPFWAMAAPLIAYSLLRFRIQSVMYVVAGILFITSLFWVFNTSSRPLLSRNSGFPLQLDVLAEDYDSTLITDRFRSVFTVRSSLAEDYSHMIEILAQSNCQDIGILNRGDEWEYPLIYTLRQRVSDIYFQHVNVTNNASLSLANNEPFVDFRPCKVVSLYGKADIVDVNSNPFILVERTNNLSIYSPNGFTAVSYHNQAYTVNIFPQENGSFHIYANCIAENCVLVSVLNEFDGRPDSRIYQEASSGGWYSVVEYLGIDPRWRQQGHNFDVYKVSVYDADNNLQDDGLEILISVNAITWRHR